MRCLKSWELLQPLPLVSGMVDGAIRMQLAGGYASAL